MPAQSLPIAGSCDARFAPVRDAFRLNFADEGEIGAAVCARVGGRTVVDLWGGFVDAEGSLAWREETLVNVFSAGKGALAMLALCAVEAGELDLDAPLRGVWPELAAARSAGLTLRALLAHRAGLPAVLAPLADAALYDWEAMCAALAAQEPFWEPGTAHGYHVNTLGFLVGEVLRRASGRRIEELLRERICGPLDASFHWGVPEALQGRIAPLLLHDQPPLPRVPGGGAVMDLAPARRAMLGATYFNPPGISGFGTVNTAAWRGAVIPSTNGHANARALAAIYEGFRVGAGGGLAIGAELRAEAARVQSDGDDLVLGRESRFGLGFQLPYPRRPLGPSAHALGHFGHGGSLGLVDPPAGVSFGYVTNRPGERFQTPRPNRLLAALYACL